MFHCGALERANRGLLKYSHPLTIDEVAHAFPRLRIVIAHMGNPWLLDCAAVMGKNEHVYADVSAFFDEFKPIAPHDVEIFVQRLGDVRLFLGSYEKLLFGTDWPLYSQAEYLAAVQALSLTAVEHERMLSGTAREIFGI
jgi:predicted TIM-barrel fold metal-dependent hydrolase